MTARIIEQPDYTGKGGEGGASPSGRAATPSGPSPSVSGIAGIPDATIQRILIGLDDARVRIKCGREMMWHQREKADDDLRVADALIDAVAEKLAEAAQGSKP